MSDSTKDKPVNNTQIDFDDYKPIDGLQIDYDDLKITGLKDYFNSIFSLSGNYTHTNNTLDEIMANQFKGLSREKVQEVILQKKKEKEANDALLDDSEFEKMYKVNLT